MKNSFSGIGSKFPASSISDEALMKADGEFTQDENKWNLKPMETKKKKPMDKIKKSLEVLEDEAAIHALVARFADASVAADYDEFAGLWSAKGKWTIHEPFQASSEGVEKIVEMMRSLRKGREFFVQFAHSRVIELKGKKATSR